MKGGSGLSYCDTPRQYAEPESNHREMSEEVQLRDRSKTLAYNLQKCQCHERLKERLKNCSRLKEISHLNFQMSPPSYPFKVPNTLSIFPVPYSLYSFSP